MYGQRPLFSLINIFRTLSHRAFIQSMKTLQQNMAIAIKSFGIFTSATLVLLVAFGLLFRATLYWKIPVALGEPAGGGDIIELLIFFGVLSFSALSLLLSIVLFSIPPWRDRTLAIILLLLSVISAPAYYLLHPLVPRLLN